MLSVPGQFAAGTERYPVRRTLQYSGESVPHLPRHLTVPELAHTPQRIATRFTDMLELAEALTDYTIFYNGPKCGASAPTMLISRQETKGSCLLKRTGADRLPGK